MTVLTFVSVFPKGTAFELIFIYLKTCVGNVHFKFKSKHTHTGNIKSQGEAAGQKHHGSVFFKVTSTHEADKAAFAELWDVC